MGEDSLLKEYLHYNPENDPNGAYGISLTDWAIERYGSIENAPKLIKINKEKNSLEKTLEILNKTHPKNLIHFGNGKVFDNLFEKLKKAGVDIKDYSRMDGTQKWNYYISLMKNFNLL